MRKNQTLLVAGILLLASTGRGSGPGNVRSLQAYPLIAREGGAAETAGDVVLFLRTGVHRAGVVTVTFSAPLAEGLQPRWVMKE